jgi:hypothetical protein
MVENCNRVHLISDSYTQTDDVSLSLSLSLSFFLSYLQFGGLWPRNEQDAEPREAQ